MSQRIDRIAVADQVLALLCDEGPMLTREVANRLPPPSYPTCGHADCLDPDHLRQVSRFPNHDAWQILNRLHRRGLVDRTPKDQTSSTMWWLPDKDRS